jgi:carbon storage regulator CsrA
MLILSRCVDQRVFLDSPSGRIVLDVCEVGARRVRIGITAPDSVRISREEVLPDEDPDKFAPHTTMRTP